MKSWNEVLNSIDTIPEIIDTSEECWRVLSCESTSKGNQRKWYNINTNQYYKEQFQYQGVRWGDYKIERYSNLIAEKLNLPNSVEVLKQKIVYDKCNDMYGVLSDNFCSTNEQWISYDRLMKKDSDLDERLFPLARFNIISRNIKNITNLDMTEYLLTMLVFDYVLLNEDRHLNNFGVILTKENTYRYSPLFDFGLGLFEHDKRYNHSVTYDNSILNRVTFKPFDRNPDTAISNILSNDTYNQIVYNLLPSKLELKEIKHSVLADSWLNYAISNLYKIVRK